MVGGVGSAARGWGEEGMDGSQKREPGSAPGQLGKGTGPRKAEDTEPRAEQSQRQWAEGGLPWRPAASKHWAQEQGTAPGPFCKWLGTVGKGSRERPRRTRALAQGTGCAPWTHRAGGCPVSGQDFRPLL